MSCACGMFVSDLYCDCDKRTPKPKTSERQKVVDPACGWADCPDCNSPRFTGRLVIDSEKMREFLREAYSVGCRAGVLDTVQYPTPPVRFNEWYLEKYDDIIEAGTEAPASEKMSEKKEIDPYDYLELRDGLGNLISRHKIENSP